MVPQPVLAVMLLFPISDSYESNMQRESEALAANPAHIPSSLFYMKQNIGNACGTIALLHSIGNNVDKIPLGQCKSGLVVMLLLFPLSHAMFPLVFRDQQTMDI